MADIKEKLISKMKIVIQEKEGRSYYEIYYLSISSLSIINNYVLIKFSLISFSFLIFVIKQIKEKLKKILLRSNYFRKRSIFFINK